MLQSLSLISTFVFASESIILESCEVIACTDVYFEQVFNSSGVATHGPTPWWTALVPAETFPSILSGGWSNYASTEPGYESRVRNNLYQKMNRFRGWTNMVQKTIQKATKIWKKNTSKPVFDRSGTTSPSYNHPLLPANWPCTAIHGYAADYELMNQGPGNNECLATPLSNKKIDVSIYHMHCDKSTSFDITVVCYHI